MGGSNHFLRLSIFLLSAATVVPAFAQAPQPIQPRSRQDLANGQNFRMTMPAELFGSVHQVNRLPADRRSRATSPGANAVFGAESKGRDSSDVGNLLMKAISAQGVSTQKRTPIVTDTRVRGQRAGQVLASGSLWVPVRSDLDTMMNKIDSRLINDVIVIKGPYSSRYGPGFRFVDFDLLRTPRYNGFESHGSTSFDYDTNGEQSYGRQSLWGGSDTWGYRISYGHRAGTDYETGNGTSIPASYKSRDLFVALGADISATQSLEFNYLRLDQTDVEFPGLVYDIDHLITNGYELTYTDANPGFADRIEAEFWYNETEFEGDTLNSGKDRQIPLLRTILDSPTGTDGFAVTDAVGSSLGYRYEAIYGCPEFNQATVGFDISHVRQELNDIEPLIPDPDDNNFPVPPSSSTDFGLFWEESVAVNNMLSLTAGTRVDFVTTQADNVVPGVPFPLTDEFDVNSLGRDFILWSGFLTANAQISKDWSIRTGVGHGQRAPTLTELYASSSFIGSLQRGLTALSGDPNLEKERMTQIDFGINGDFETVRVGSNAYFSWVDDLITYDLLVPAGGTVGGLNQDAQYLNTDEATIAGFEAYAEADVQPWLTAFGTISYIEGRDLSRNEASRLSGGDRSGVAGQDNEALPGITPLESRLGLRFQDPSPQRNWGLEFSARIVDDQDRVAASLEEIATPGFTTYDVRYFKRQGPWLFTAGIENLTDKQYREHLDYRSGRGVFRPGINFYSGIELTY